MSKPNYLSVALLIVSLTLAGCAGKKKAVDNRDTQSWAGFYSPYRINDKWLTGHKINLKKTIINGTFPRVGKLVISRGLQKIWVKEAQTLNGLYCSKDAAPWNEDFCKSIKSLICEKENCSCIQFTNCSGFFIGKGLFLTSAKCVKALVDDPAIAMSSTIVVQNSVGWGNASFHIGKINLPKNSALDVASIEVNGAGLDQIWGTAPVPHPGSLIWVFGFPKVEKRTSGMPGLSFGKVTELSQEAQQHFRASFSNNDGFAGGPVFDSEGRLVGIASEASIISISAALGALNIK
jgi:hypothetical protein